MQIKCLEIKNIRNITYKKINFQKNNIIIGENAQGKTTIAECIYFCCFYKSFRTKNIENMINFNSTSATIKLIYEENQKLNTIQINLYKNQKKFFFNKKEVKNVYEIINKIKCILITPNNIDLVEDSPNKRRKYINILLSQYNFAYLKELVNYNKLVKIKATVLKKHYLTKKIDKIYLNIINQKLEKLNENIVSERTRILKNIETKINETLTIITDGKEKISIKYVEKSKNQEKNEIYKKELQIGKIIKGNHLDDFSFSLNGKDTKTFASQGQKRLITLCFFLAQKNLDKNKYLIIFDDVSIDLDKRRQQKLIQYLENTNQNIYISTDILKLLMTKDTKDKSNIINMP